MARSLLQIKNSIDFKNSFVKVFKAQSVAGDIQSRVDSALFGPSNSDLGSIRNILNGNRNDLTENFYRTFLCFFFNPPESLPFEKQPSIDQLILFFSSLELAGKVAESNVRRAYNSKIKNIVESDLFKNHPFSHHSFEMCENWKLKIVHTETNEVVYDPMVYPKNGETNESVENPIRMKNNKKHIGIGVIAVLGIALIVVVTLLLSKNSGSEPADKEAQGATKSTNPQIDMGENNQFHDKINVSNGDFHQTNNYYDDENKEGSSTNQPVDSSKSDDTAPR